MGTERNILIDAYQGAGAVFLASRLLMLFATDAEIAAHSHPAVRSHYAEEIQLMLGQEGVQALCLDMAERALMIVHKDVEGDTKHA